MPALLDQVIGRFVAAEDFNKLALLGMIFAEVSTKAALTIVYVNHFDSSFQLLAAASKPVTRRVSEAESLAHVSGTGVSDATTVPQGLEVNSTVAVQFGPFA